MKLFFILIYIAIGLNFGMFNKSKLDNKFKINICLLIIYQCVFWLPYIIATELYAFNIRDRIKNEQEG